MVLLLGVGLTLTLIGLLTGAGAGLPVAHAAELHVCPGGCPYSSVQAAVDAAGTGDVIKVAAGTYTGVSARAGVTQVVYISKTITIQGGYTTTNWTTPYPITQPTTLDAQKQGGVLYITGNTSPTIEALHITGGTYVYDLGQDLYLGGGIYVISAAPTISGNWVFSNSLAVGGGLYLWNSKATVRGNWIYSNTGGSGGGLLVSDSDAILSENWVFGNSASRGGGLALISSDAVINGNSIFSNSATSRGGGLYLMNSAATLNANTIMSNSATNPGFSGFGGGAYLESSSASVSDNSIAYNTANNGGGMAVDASSATLSSNVIRFNTATSWGGGAYLFNSPSGGGTVPPVLVGNTIVSNTALAGGGLFFTLSDATLINNLIANNQVTGGGSGLFVGWSSPRLMHNTIARNTGGEGSAIYVDSLSDFVSNVTLTNTILVSHTVGITVKAGNTATLQGTLWGSGAWANGTNAGGGGAIISSVNVFSNPEFISPSSGNYHITATSAAVNAGVNASVNLDIDNQPRPYQAPDLGADEYWPPGVLKYIYLPVTLKNYP
jgi:hypothetical protein